MTTKRTPPSKAGAKVLKLKKETLKDLDAKRRGGDVKAGALLATAQITCGCSVATCELRTCKCIK